MFGLVMVQYCRAPTTRQYVVVSAFEKGSLMEAESLEPDTIGEL
jgi:hypothetical protein